MKKEKAQIYALPEGTRIKLLSLADHDGWYGHKDLINKEYDAFKTDEFFSTAFRQQGTNKVYVFAGGAKYKIIKKELV